MNWNLSAQRVISWAFFFLWWPLLSIFFYILMAIKLDKRKQIQRQFETIYKNHDGPILICSNHLTLIDSIIIQYYLGSYLKYLFSFDRFIWSFPERKNFSGNLFLNVITYLGKCIHVKRNQGNLKKQNLIQKIDYFKEKKQVISIFPEATRSRSGRIIPEQTSYGVGEIIQRIPKIKVLCLYLRAEKQSQYSNFPPRTARYQAFLKEIFPASELSGRKMQKDLSLQIIGQLKTMEEEYFANRS